MGKKKAREARTPAGTINRSFDHAEKEIAADGDTAV